MKVIPVETDQASLVVFDPENLQGRVREGRDWWQLQPQHVVEEVAEGQVGIFAVGRDGSYRISLRTSGSLTEAEQAFAVGEARGYGLSVVSEQIFFGVSERLPCEGRGKVLSQIPMTGGLFPIENGNYEIVVHVLHWREEDRFYDEDNEVLPEAPADFVFELRSVPERLQVRSSPPPLLDLIPKKERKGTAKVRFQPKRRRASTPETTRRRRGGGKTSQAAHRGGSPPRQPRHVPDTVAAYSEGEVRAAFREVLTETSLHPADGIQGILRLDLIPLERKNVAHDIDMHALLKKGLRVREQIRVLEAKVNSRLSPVQANEFHPALTGVYRAIDELFDFLAEEAPEPPPAAEPAPEAAQA
jgi:uncharacterized protein DUF6386